jgi:hypothetical protein
MDDLQDCLVARDILKGDAESRQSAQSCQRYTPLKGFRSH